MSTPETIYLIPGEYEEGLVWCDDPAPDSYSDPGEAVKYVRAVSVPEWTDINLRQPEEYQDVLWFCQGGNIRTGMR